MHGVHHGAVFGIEAACVLAANKVAQFGGADLPVHTLGARHGDGVAAEGLEVLDRHALADEQHGHVGSTGGDEVVAEPSERFGRKVSGVGHENVPLIALHPVVDALTIPGQRNLYGPPDGRFERAFEGVVFGDWRQGVPLSATFFVDHEPQRRGVGRR